MSITVLHGGDSYGMDRFVESAINRMVDASLRTWNVGKYDMKVPGDRFTGWEAARTPPWGGDTRVVVLDHLEAIDKFKGSGVFDDKEVADPTPSEKGNRLKSINALSAGVDFACQRTSGVHLICLVHGPLATSGSAVGTVVAAARSHGGQVLEFSKSAFYDRDGRTAEVQRIAEGEGLLLDDDVAGVISYQLGEDHGGHQIQAEVQKLMMWQAQTGLELDVVNVGELCSTGKITPPQWADAVVKRSLGRRGMVNMTEDVIAQGFDLMELLGVLLTKASAAYVFKSLEGMEANEGEIAQVLGWSNPRRFYPFRREHRRADAATLRHVCETCLRWREKVIGEGLVADKSAEFRLLMSELLGDVDPFELRELDWQQA